MTKIPLALRRAPLAVALLAAGCGASATTSTPAGAAHRHARHRVARPVAAAPTHLGYRRLFSLPAPLRDPASAAVGGTRFVLVGGLTAADVSADEIDLLDLGHVIASGTLPGAQHDAQGTGLNGRAYVFGGGNLTEYDHILAVDTAARTVTQVGSLPAPASDVAVTSIGATAYVVGGFDGSSSLNTIVAWRPGSAARVVGHLPVGLRYSAVTAVGDYVMIIGGETPAGAVRTIYRFDTRSGRLDTIGQLPAPITHGEAAALDGTVFLIGGRGNLDNEQSAAIWAINPLNGAIRPAGRLPEPLSDSGVLKVDGAIVLVGGLTPSGAVSAAVGELVPRP